MTANELQDHEAFGRSAGDTGFMSVRPRLRKLANEPGKVHQKPVCLLSGLALQAHYKLATLTSKA